MKYVNGGKERRLKCKHSLHIGYFPSQQGRILSFQVINHSCNPFPPFRRHVLNHLSSLPPSSLRHIYIYICHRPTDDVHPYLSVHPIS